MKLKILIILGLFAMFSTSVIAQTYNVEFYKCSVTKKVRCTGCDISTKQFNGIVLNGRGRDYAFYSPVKITSKGSMVTFEDAFGSKKTVSLSKLKNVSNIPELNEMVANAFCDEGATSINDLVPSNEYVNDADAAANGVAIGDWYIVQLGNTMGSGRVIMQRQY